MSRLSKILFWRWVWARSRNARCPIVPADERGEPPRLPPVGPVALGGRTPFARAPHERGGVHKLASRGDRGAAAFCPNWNRGRREVDPVFMQRGCEIVRRPDFDIIRPPKVDDPPCAHKLAIDTEDAQVFRNSKVVRAPYPRSWNKTGYEKQILQLFQFVSDSRETAAPPSVRVASNHLAGSS